MEQCQSLFRRCVQRREKLNDSYEIFWQLNTFVAYIRVCVLLLFLGVFPLSEDATTIAWIGSQPLNRKDSSREEVGVAR